MDQVESLLSVITFVLKSINPGQVDDMDIQLLKSFSISHMVIAESLRTFNDNVNASNLKEKGGDGRDDKEERTKERTNYITKTITSKPYIRNCSLSIRCLTY